jgi:Outer membrane protein beta-barrel domain
MTEKRLLLGATRILWFVLLSASRYAMAQAGYTDAGELSIFGGGSFGAGTHGAVGGSAGAALARYGMLLLGTSYMPLGGHTIQSWPPQSTVQSSHLWDIAVDVHIRIPVKDRWEPYAIIGTGLLWDKVRQQSVDPTGASVNHNYDQFNGAFHTGGGVRYFIGRAWGIRPEIKAIITKQTYTQVSIGIFYVTSGQWP